MHRIQPTSKSPWQGFEHILYASSVIATQWRTETGEYSPQTDPDGQTSSRKHFRRLSDPPPFNNLHLQLWRSTVAGRRPVKLRHIYPVGKCLLRYPAASVERYYPQLETKGVRDDSTATSDACGRSSKDSSADQHWEHSIRVS